MGLEPAKPEEKPAEPSAQTDEPPQPTIEPVDRATPPFVLLAVVMAITLTVIFFAATTTAASDASVRPYAISLAVGAGVVQRAAWRLEGARKRVLERADHGVVHEGLDVHNC